ncbi:Uncharacterized protein GBIM_17427, partial [Gryllus bimaculatus]
SGASVFGLDSADITSTTTGLDSVLDGHTENNSSEDDLSTAIDATDAHAIRKQLEGLEHMYSEEMENIRSEISALRTQTLAVRSQSMPRGLNAVGAPLSTASGGLGPSGLAGGDGAANLSNPARVKKLTKFFGDEPPLLRLFLKRLGYEKYAPAFEQERVGMVELPYLSEERLQRLGVPLGPRLRILQEAAAHAAPMAPAPPPSSHAGASRGDKVYVV